MKPSSSNATAPASTVSHDSLAASLSTMLLLTVFQRLIGFVRGVLFCNYLPPNDLGEWDLAFGFLMLAAPLAVLGLPGSFGRYLPRFTQQGRLRSLLRRSTMISSVCAAMAVITLVVFSTRASELIFGQSGREREVCVLAGTLAIVIIHHYLESLFAAMRVFRVVSSMHFIQSTLFAVIGAALLILWHPNSTSVVLAYGIASGISITRGAFWLLQNPIRDNPAPGHSRESELPIWRKMMTYAAWMWITNLVANLFQVVDRYMVLHYSGLPVDDALAAVGDYHSSRVVPMLLVSIAGLLGSMLMPYLSHSWEAGDRQGVSDRLNFYLKLTGIGLLLGGVVVLAASPLIFQGLLHGKYEGGREVMPLTLVYCTWYGILLVAQNYLFCREQARLSSAALLAGLLINIVANFVLVPQFGLIGAVVGTVLANFATLGLTYLASHAFGMTVHRGTILTSLAPACLGFGLYASLAATICLLFFALRSELIFTHSEQADIRQEIARLAQRFGVTRRSFYISENNAAFPQNG